MVQVPFIDAVGFRQELALIPSVEDACSTEDGTSTGTLGGDAIKKDAMDNPSNWEDIATLLKMVICFIAPKPLTSGMKEFFLFSHRHFIDLLDDLHVAGVVRPSHVTLESALRCTYPLLEYIAKETVEVVRFTHFSPNLLNRSALIPDLILFQGVVAIHSLMRQQSSLLKWLEDTENMQIFLTREIDNSAELCAQFAWVESKLEGVWKATTYT